MKQDLQISCQCEYEKLDIHSDVNKGNTFDWIYLNSKVKQVLSPIRMKKCIVGALISLVRFLNTRWDS